MNNLTKFLLISLSIHLLIICVIFKYGSWFVHPDKTVVVDFTLLDRGGSESAGNNKNLGPTKRGNAKPDGSENKNKFFAQKVQNLRADSTHLNSTPAGTTEPARLSPTTAPAATTVSAAAAPSSSTAISTGKSGNEATTGGSGSAHGGGSGGSGSGRGQANAGNGAGNSSDQLRKRYLAEQFEYIKNLIEKNIKYPARALRMGWSGKVVVSFTILENGRVSNMKIINSSGHDLLDENILETIKTVEPFPKPPVSASLKIPFNYRTEQ